MRLRCSGIRGGGDPGNGRRLRGDGTERRGVPDLVPSLGGEGRAPAQLPDRCPAIGDAGERPVVVPPGPSDATLGDFDHAFHAQAPYGGWFAGSIEAVIHARMSREKHANWLCNRTATVGVTQFPPASSYALSGGCSGLSEHCARAEQDRSGGTDRRSPRRVAPAPRRGRCNDLHHAARTGTQPGADQLHRVAGVADRSNPGPRGAADLDPRRQVQHRRPEPPERSD